MNTSSEKLLRTLEVIMLKEELLNEIISWLKTKELWEECQKSLSIKVNNTNNIKSFRNK